MSEVKRVVGSIHYYRNKEIADKLAKQVRHDPPDEAVTNLLILAQENGVHPVALLDAYQNFLVNKLRSHKSNLTKLARKIANEQKRVVVPIDELMRAALPELTEEQFEPVSAKRRFRSGAGEAAPNDREPS